MSEGGPTVCHQSHTPRGITSLHNTCSRPTTPSMKGMSVCDRHSNLFSSFTCFRLNLQHRVIRRACGGKLYFAPIHLDDGDAVLESGVGTGTLPKHTCILLLESNITVRPMDARIRYSNPRHRRNPRNRYRLPAFPSDIPNKHRIIHRVHHFPTRRLEWHIRIRPPETPPRRAHHRHVEIRPRRDLQSAQTGRLGRTRRNY